MSARTPGPLLIRRSNDGSGDVGITAAGLPNVIAECFGAIRHHGERAIDEAMANATLFIASPDMLAALRPLADLPIGAEIEFDRDLVIYKNAGKSVTVGDVLDARAAIDKAEGRS